MSFVPSSDERLVIESHREPGPFEPAFKTAAGAWEYLEREAASALADAQAHVDAIRLNRACFDMAILVWPFHSAPVEYRALSDNGGAADWLAILPAGMAEPYWMQSGGPFGVCCTESHDLNDGRKVVIGSHS